MQVGVESSHTAKWEKSVTINPLAVTGYRREQITRSSSGADDGTGISCTHTFPQFSHHHQFGLISKQFFTSQNMKLLGLSEIS